MEISADTGSLLSGFDFPECLYFFCSSLFFHFSFKLDYHVDLYATCWYLHKKKKRKAMCLNGIQNILENELGAKCTNFIFLSEATIFLLRNEKNPFLTLKPIYFVK